MDYKLEFNQVTYPQGSTVVATCPELSITVTADTEERAHAQLLEAVTTLVQDGERDHQLEAILQEAGFTPRDGTWTAPAIRKVDRVTATVHAIPPVRITSGR